MTTPSAISFHVLLQLRSNGNTNKMWAAFVGKELPCKRVHTNPKDPFIVVVTKGGTKLIVGPFYDQFPQSARCFYDEAV